MMVEIVEFALHKDENIHKDLAHYIVRQINCIHDYRFTPLSRLFLIVLEILMFDGTILIFII